MLAAYRLYLFILRRRIAREPTPYPEARLSTGGGPSSPTLMSHAYGPGGESDRRSMSESNWGGSSYALAGYDRERNSSFRGPAGPFSPPARSGANSPSSQGRASPETFTYEAPLGARPGSTSPHGGSSSGGNRRRSYGPEPLRVGSPSNRLSGAPHANRSFIDIVVPLPLAPPPGAVVSTGKSTLGFAPNSGIGEGPRTRNSWFVTGDEAQSRGIRVQRNQAYDGVYPSREYHSSGSTLDSGHDAQAIHRSSSSPTSAPGSQTTPLAFPDPTRLSPPPLLDKLQRGQQREADQNSSESE